MKALAAAGRVLTRRHWAWMIALALGMDVLVSLHSTVNPQWMGWRMLYHAQWWLAFGAIFLLALAWAEGSSSPSIPSMSRYLAGALAAACLCIGLAGAFAPWVKRPVVHIVAGKLGPSSPKRMEPGLTRYNAIFNLGVEASFRGVFITLVYAGWRRSRHAERLLAEAELARAQARRELLASQLAVSRQVVDPDGVFEKLARIEEMYADDPVAAEVLMDQLIESLRAAIPRMRADLSVEGHAA